MAFEWEFRKKNVFIMNYWQIITNFAVLRVWENKTYEIITKDLSSTLEESFELESIEFAKECCLRKYKQLLIIDIEKIKRLELDSANK